MVAPLRMCLALAAALALVPKPALADVAPEVGPQEACASLARGDVCQVESEIDGYYAGECADKPCEDDEGDCLTCVKPGEATKDDDDGGCNCRSGRAGAGLGLLGLAGLALLGLRRRRPVG